MSVVSVIALALLTSCSVKGSLETKHSLEDDCKDTVIKVMQYIKDEKTDEIIALFSPDTNRQCLENEFDEMYRYLKGKVISYGDIIHTGYSTMSNHYGDITQYTSSPEIRDVKTESGQVLYFELVYTIIDDKNPESIGLNQITIYSQTEFHSIEERQLTIDGIADY